MAREKKKTGDQGRPRVIVKRDESGAEAVQKKPDPPPTLHPDTGSLAEDVDATKATSTSAERIVSGIAAAFRPIAKELIKGGIVLADNVAELASETGEKFKDLLAEAKSELETSKSQAQETEKTDGKDGS
jgi:hypothetical protein